MSQRGVLPRLWILQPYERSDGCAQEYQNLPAPYWEEDDPPTPLDCFVESKGEEKDEEKQGQMDDEFTANKESSLVSVKLSALSEQGTRCPLTYG